MFFLKLLWWFHLFSSSWWVLDNKFHTLLHLFTTPPPPAPPSFSLFSSQPQVSWSRSFRRCSSATDLNTILMHGHKVGPAPSLLLPSAPSPSAAPQGYVYEADGGWFQGRGLRGVSADLKPPYIRVWCEEVKYEWENVPQLLLHFYFYVSSVCVCVCVWESKYE